MAISKEDILEAVSSMSVLDLSDLIKEMEEKFGVSAAAAAVAAPAAAAGGGDAAGGEEKSEFDPKEWKDVRDMKEKLIEEGFLAFPHFDYIQTDETELDRDETKLVEKGKYNWDRLTMERKRNMEIKK